MNRYWSVLTLVLLSTTLLNGQALSKKEWKAALQAYYKQYKKLNTAKKYIYRKELFEREKFFVEVPSSPEIAKTRELVAKTAKIEILDVGMGPQLAFKANISDGYPGFISDQVDISFIEANLKTEDGQVIELQNLYQSGAEGNTLLHRVDLASDRPPKANTISGKAIYDISFLLRYDQVKLSLKNEGESFILAGCKFTLVEVLHNQVILEKSCDDDIHLQFINWGKEGYFLSPYPYNELMDMAAKDPRIDTEGSFSQSTSSISKKMYQLFKQHPNLSGKQLRKAFPRANFDRLLREGESYLVLSNVAPIEGKFTIFAPVYETDEVVVEY